MSRHTFKTWIETDSAADSDRLAKEVCDEYFGDTPYGYTISTKTVYGEYGMVGYEATVTAHSVPSSSAWFDEPNASNVDRDADPDLLGTLYQSGPPRRRRTLSRTLGDLMWGRE